MSNPLQQYFRQPKIYIKLPSKGLYSNPGTVQGDVSKLPVYGMTGMDEIIIRTPDALLSGEATVKIIESCIPGIKDAWNLSSIDMNIILIALRIATYGNILNVSHICGNCQAENDYEVDLNKTVDYFQSCEYENTVHLKDLTIKLKPLSYRQITDFALRNFQVSQQAQQILRIPEVDQTDDHRTKLRELYSQLAAIQNDIYMASVENVETTTVNVTEQRFILEWLKNCDKEVFDKIRDLSENNIETWSMPKTDATCTACQHQFKLAVELDQSNFFE